MTPNYDANATIYVYIFTFIVMCVSDVVCDYEGWDIYNYI